MIALDHQSELLQRLQEVHRSCPEMRLGQLLATVGMLGEDSTDDPSGRSRMTSWQRPSSDSPPTLPDARMADSPSTRASLGSEPAWGQTEPAWVSRPGAWGQT